MILSQMMLYVLPGLLGRGFDMKNKSVGIDIFTPPDINDLHTINKYSTIIEYKVVDSAKSARDFLDVNGNLALKLKSGMLNVEGKGSYLKDTHSFDKSVDILIKVHYETIARMLPTNIKPRAVWRKEAEVSGDTHYIRSILYGGDLIASLRFTAKNAGDKEQIKAQVNGDLKSNSGSFSLGINGTLDKLSKTLTESTSMEINYYATIPIQGVPKTIDGLMELVEKFPNQTREINDGYGVPINMEVLSLSTLDSTFPPYYEILALQDQLNMLEERFDDIRNTKRRLSDWMRTIPAVLDEDHQAKIGEFSTKIETLARTFNKVIANLDLTKDASPEQFKAAFEAYDEDGVFIPDKYNRKLSKLKQEILEATKSLEAELGGAFYTNWGTQNCPKDSEFIYKGMASGTGRNQLGSAEYLCYPEDPKEGTEIKGYDKTDIISFPTLRPIVYYTRKEGATAQRKVPCSKCRVSGRTTSVMLPGRTECPDSEWKLQYSGVLVSAEKSQIRGDAFCMNERIVDQPAATGDLDELSLVTEVSVACPGNLPCDDTFKSDTAIPCVVCSHTKASPTEKTSVLMI